MPPPPTSFNARMKVSSVLFTDTVDSLKRLLRSFKTTLSRIRYSGTKNDQPSEPAHKPSLDSGERTSNLTEEEVRMSGALPNDDCCGRHPHREGCVTGSCAARLQTSVL